MIATRTSGCTLSVGNFSLSRKIKNMFPYLNMLVKLLGSLRRPHPWQTWLGHRPAAVLLGRTCLLTTSVLYVIPGRQKFMHGAPAVNALYHAFNFLGQARLPPSSTIRRYLGLTCVHSAALPPLARQRLSRTQHQVTRHPSVFTVNVPCISNELQWWFVTTVFKACTTTRSKICLGSWSTAAPPPPRRRYARAQRRFPVHAQEHSYVRRSGSSQLQVAGHSPQASTHSARSTLMTARPSVVRSGSTRQPFFNVTDDLTHLPFDVEACRTLPRLTLVCKKPPTQPGRSSALCCFSRLMLKEQSCFTSCLDLES